MLLVHYFHLIHNPTSCIALTTPIQCEDQSHCYLFVSVKIQQDIILLMNPLITSFIVKKLKIVYLL